MIKKNEIDYSLYVIIDQDWIRERDLIQLTEAIISGGATILQYRNKSGSGLQFFENARLIHTMSKSHNIPLIINDRVDVAKALDAEGVHVGQDDIPISVVRQLVGPDKLVGLSISDLTELESIEAVDYLGVGTMFTTETKRDAEFGGLELMKQVRQNCNLPLVGIGGINSENGGDVIRAGADGLSVISVILGADDPELATKQMREMIKKTKQEMPHTEIR